MYYQNINKLIFIKEKELCSIILIVFQGDKYKRYWLTFILATIKGRCTKFQLKFLLTKEHLLYSSSNLYVSPLCLKNVIYIAAQNSPNIQGTKGI